ncbi:hypothetical protein [Pararhodospirillum oryzae]|uniref:Uncharacterized protein n=1 Tax=Pararhodospirillum oryzae TaxID=478448 RepID=A0A512H5D2_9PROT|nr:hypothetical protein [Pararhodospirillum oryzae]GEO80580.1 hypothetical protein ROR02_07110 [Pararhodospirillum oryzae]
MIILGTREGFRRGMKHLVVAMIALLAGAGAGAVLAAEAPSVPGSRTDPAALSSTVPRASKPEEPVFVPPETRAVSFPTGAVSAPAVVPVSSPSGRAERAPPFPAAPASAPASAREVRVTAADCARLVAYEPGPDVAYRPGVDVHGNPVAPADLEDWSRWTGGVEKGFVLPLAIDPFAASGLSAPHGLSQPAVSIGTLAYDVASGRMTLDGAPLSDPQTSAIAAACRAHDPGR